MKNACICALAVVVMAQFTFAADDYSQWTYWRNVVLNTKASGAMVANPVLRFPVLVRLGAADSLVFKNAQANGRDIRFAKYDGTHFRYQIEQWNATTRVAAIWVLADSVRGNDSSAYMVMYWGNTAAADSQNGYAVFDTANGFAAVYHLGDSTANAIDATINACSLTPSGHTTSELTAGMIGNAQSFGGSNDWYTSGTPAPAALNISNNRVTVSAWAYVQGGGGWGGIATKYTWSANRCCYQLIYNANTSFYWMTDITGAAGSGEDIINGPAGVATNTWYFLTGTFNGTTMQLYQNAALAASAAQTGMYSSASSPFIIGSGDGNQAFNGIIDEVTISKVARDTNWIMLCYQNQMGPPQTLVTLGPILGNLYITSQPKSLWVAAGDTASFTVIAGGITPISYRWIHAPDTVGTASTLTLNAVQAGANNSVYQCLVSNAKASLMSNPCTLYVATAPVIISQPANQSVPSGSNASFSVTAMGLRPLSYKWARSPYAAADTIGTAATLALTSVQASADNSIYKCIVRNSDGSAVSNPCTLHVLITPPPPTIVSPAPNEMIRTDSVVFRWNKGGNGATLYMIQLALDSAATNIVYEDSSITDTTRTVRFSFVTQSYWFRIKAYNSVGWGVFSASQKFTITTTSALPGAAAAAAAAAPFGVSVKGNELRYSLPRASSVCVKLYDPSGRLVATLVKKTHVGAGSYQAPLGKITAGLYVMTFEADGFAQRKTIVIP